MYTIDMNVNIGMSAKGAANPLLTSYITEELEVKDHMMNYKSFYKKMYYKS